MTASQLINLSSSIAIDFKTPEEMWMGKILYYSNLRVFGCATYTHQFEDKL